MDKRDLGVILVMSTYILLTIRAAYSYIIEGLSDPINLYHNVTSDPILFLTNLVLYLIGSYLIVTLSAKDVRDMWINILFFIIPTMTVLFIILYLLIFSGVTGLLLLYGTSQFPLYHVALVILSGIIVVSRQGKVNISAVYYALPFIGLMALYGVIRVFYGISAAFFFIFLIIAGIVSIYLTRKFFK